METVAYGVKAIAEPSVITKKDQKESERKMLAEIAERRAKAKAARKGVG